MKVITDEQFKQYDEAFAAVQTKASVDVILSHMRATRRAATFAVDGKEVRHLTEVKFPKEGGILTYYENCKYPRKGFPHNDTVQKVDDLKKICKAILSGFRSFRGKPILLFFLLLFRKRLKSSFNTFLTELHFTISFHILRPERYCISVRELYKAIPHEELRDMISMVLEFDDAYRYRFQDVVSEINLENFSGNPLQELRRLLLILESRESDPRLKKTWKSIRNLLFVSFFFRDIREPIIECISKLNPQNIRMDEGDRYQASFKDGYDWNHIKN